MIPTTQKALILTGVHGEYKLVDRSVPAPGPGEVLVEARSLGLNPLDWKIQEYGYFVERFPIVVGVDAAGIVVAVGAGVTNFQVGDTIVSEGNFDDDHMTHQQYFLALADISAKVPANVSLDQAASLPLALATAAAGLWNQGTPAQSVGLAHPPWEARSAGRYAGKPLFVFGGATSIGQFVLQLARLAGFAPVIATASPHNTALLTSLGATHVLDRALPPSALAAALADITRAPLEIVFDAVSARETQNAGYDLLAPGGTLVVVLDEEIDAGKKAGGEGGGKKVVHAFGSFHPEANRALGVSLYAHLAGLLESGAIKPNRVEVLQGGLAGIPGDLERLRQDKVSGYKLVAHPQENL